MAIDETVRSYQTRGEPVTKKTDKTPRPPGVDGPAAVGIQFDDVSKKELSHSECMGCNY